MKDRVVIFFLSRIPADDQTKLIEMEAKLGSQNPTMIGFAFRNNARTLRLFAFTDL